MKIYLQAFGDNFFNKILEVPENTTQEFKMRLTSPISYYSFEGQELDNRKLETECIFKWNGKNISIGDDFARVYILIDIIKI